MIDDALSFGNITKEEVVDWRNAKFYESGDDYSDTYKGYLILTKSRLLLISETRLFRAMRKLYDVDVSKITKVFKIPLTSSFIVYANTAEKGTGFFKRLFKHKDMQVKLDDATPFFNKLKELNLYIK